MKPKYITPDNYQQFKPSELVHSFISDIEVAEKIGKPMDMAIFEESWECLPCMGGMGVMNWNHHEINGTLRHNIEQLGDDIRVGRNISPRLNTLYGNVNVLIMPTGTECFSHLEKIKTKSRFTALKHQVMLYVKELEKHGL